jgi:hypothetical protein
MPTIGNKVNHLRDPRSTWMGGNIRAQDLRCAEACTSWVPFSRRQCIMLRLQGGVDQKGGNTGAAFGGGVVLGLVNSEWEHLYVVRNVTRDVRKVVQPCK